MVELQILNKILKTKSMQLVILNGLDESFFPNYKDQYSFIKKHYDTYNVVPDPESFVDKFPQFDFIQVNESDEYLADKIYEQHMYEQAVPQMNKLFELMSAKEVNKGIDYLRSIADDLNKVRRADKCLDLIQDAEIRFQEYLVKSRDLNRAYISTGYPELDKLLGGWDVGDELAIISARPGRGKSWVLFSFAAAAAKNGLRVGLYSGEMSESKVGYRVDTLLYHISNWAISHGDVSVQVDYENCIKNIKEDVKGSIKVITPRILGDTATVSQIRAFIEKEQIEIMIIDQFSLLRDQRGSRDRTIAGENISKDLKTLQQIKKIPIILAAQLGRGAVSKDKKFQADVDDLTITDRLGQDASVVIGLNQEDKLLVMSIFKSRFGEDNKKINYLWDKNKGTFIYSPTEQDALVGEGSEDLKSIYQDSSEEVF